MFAKTTASKRRKELQNGGGLRVTRRGRRKYAVLPVRDITFFKAAPTECADGKRD